MPVRTIFCLTKTHKAVQHHSFPAQQIETQQIDFQAITPRYVL